jgi:hypothetical protein
MPVEKDMSSRLSIATVVAAHEYDSFCQMRQSLEQFDATAYRWFIRCDERLEPGLRRLEQTKLVSFPAINDRDQQNLSRRVLQEKTNAIGDAWQLGSCDSVVFIAPDICFTGPTLQGLTEIPGELLLSPHYFPWKVQQLAPYFGYFNSGFLLTRSPSFHSMWRDAFLASPWKYGDQGCLNEVASSYSVSLLDRAANVGPWRSKRASAFLFTKIPTDCKFVRVPMFGPLRTPDDWINRAFTLHFLKFLQASGSVQHAQLRESIIMRDGSGWHRASLRLSDSVDSRTVLTEGDL